MIKHIIFFINSFIIYFTFVTSQTSETTWINPANKIFYDFSSLTSSTPYTIKYIDDIFEYSFQFNFGKNNRLTCQGNSDAQIIKNFQIIGDPSISCEVLGRELKNISLIDQSNPYSGLSIEYQNGDMCFNIDDGVAYGSDRITRFNIICSNSQDSSFSFDIPIDKKPGDICNLVFKINSPAGCPYGRYYKYTWTIILLWTLFFFSLYFFIGMLYKIKIYNLSGFEALPNSEFWQNFPGYVKDGCVFSYININKAIEYIFYNSKKAPENYMDI
jgi:hypothetical protein